MINKFTTDWRFAEGLPQSAWGAACWRSMRERHPFFIATSIRET